MSIKAFFPCGGGSNFNFRDRYRKPNIFSENSSCCQVFSQNCQIMTFWYLKKSLPTQVHLYNPYRALTLFPREIIIFPGVLTKFNFWTKFPVLEKFADLMKDLKYKHQSIFLLWGRVKLNFRDRYGKPNIFSENSSCCQGFSQNCQIMIFWY